MADRIGQQFGNYLLTLLLGEGGFAEVYLGKHLHLGTLAAVKVLHSRLITGEQEAFLREARTIAELEHPSIIRVLDCGIEAERKEPFIIMQYAPRGTLRQRYAQSTHPSLPTIIAAIKQISSALDYAHERHLIHRDVKPENILLGSNDELLLSDFGIALISSSSASKSMEAMAGTVAYMAPEQITGKPRAASDQYALGIVVYEWLSGAVPFHGSFSETCAQHLYAPPPALSETLPWLHPEVEQVVLKALAKEPQERFASVGDFAAALEHHLSSQISQLSAMEATNISSSPPVSTILAPSAINDPLPAQQAVITPPSEENKLSPTIAVDDASLLAVTVPPAANNQPATLQPGFAFLTAPFSPILESQREPDRRPTSRNSLISLASLFIAALLVISTFGYLALARSFPGNASGGNSPFYSGSPTKPVQAQASASTSLPATSMSDISPTPTATLQPSPTPTATPTLPATPTPTATPAAPILQPTPTPRPTPTPTPRPTSTPTPLPTQPPVAQPTLTTDCAHLVVPWVAIYQYSNYGGRELCFEGTGLINLAEFGFDKQTMSINIAANGAFFDQSGGQGNELSFYYGDEHADLGNWDNRISSFLVDG